MLTYSGFIFRNIFAVSLRTFRAEAAPLRRSMWCSEFVTPFSRKTKILVVGSWGDLYKWSFCEDWRSGDLGVEEAVLV